MKIKAVKRILDSALVVTLLLLMSFHVTQQFAHEWIGVTMLALTILHQVLNRKYYSAIFKGKYTPLRVFQLIVNVFLVLSFLCTAASGLIMSRYTAPYLNGVLQTSLVRQAHLSLSHWSFVLMGLHLGLHLGIISSKLKKRSVKIALGILTGVVAVCGFYLFFTARFFDYMFLRIPFAYFDYSKAWYLVIVENLVMLTAWAFAAYLISLLLKKINKDK